MSGSTVPAKAFIVVGTGEGARFFAMPERLITSL